MLTCLYIENIAIIKRVSIDFSDGFTILTGETGAGKSILIDSLGLILGNKARKELIGSFGEYAFVKASFLDLPQPAIALLAENDIPIADGEVFVERKIGKDGRSTAKINSVQVSISFLQNIAPFLINILGQHDHILMLNSDHHIEFLDQYAKLEQKIEQYRNEYTLLRQYRKKLQDLDRLSKERDSKLNSLNYKLQEYERVDPYLGKLSYLQDKRKLLQNQKSVNEFVASIRYNDDRSLVTIISHALSKAEKLSQIDDRFKEICTQLENMQEIASSVVIQGDDIAAEFSLSESLNDVEDKIYDLQQLLSRYGPTEEDLLLDWEETKKELDFTDSLDQRIQDCKTEYVEQLHQVQDIAAEISEIRKESAARLSKRVQDELAYLDMNGVRFEISVQNNLNQKGGFVYNSRGYDRVEFLISTNVGQQAKPLCKIASGGELSRFMLSLTNALSDQQQVSTMIFDEVDTGVSGKTAEKIGVKLKEVASDRQVLCISHLAQIASMGDHHYKISKSVTDGLTQTHVKLLEQQERVDEISRIIGGIEITDTVRKTAHEMIQKNT